MAKILQKRGCLSVYDERNKFFQWDNYKFCYQGYIPLWDFIDIIYPNLDKNKFIEKNIINNSAFFHEGPYEKGGARLEMGDYVIDAGANFGLFSILAREKSSLSR
ncbi:MAG: hypothetical protein ACP5IX_02520 [Patescibacteria group bacterium]